MKKILCSIKDFCKKYLLKNKVISVFIGLIILVILLFVIFNGSGVDNIKRVTKVLSNKYYKIECMSDTCDYIIAYKGNVVGKSKISIYNAKGKKIAAYKEKFNMNSLIIRNIYAVNKNYIIFDKTNGNENKSAGYAIAKTNGKEIYTTSNSLTGINDYLVSEKLEESYNIVDKNGKVLYTNVKNIKGYSDNKIVTATIKNEDVVLNEKGSIILNGYDVEKQVKDEDGNTLYLVVQDSNKNAYYYYNIKSSKIVGDAFNSYTNGSNTGELIITKKNNNDLVKYVLKADGRIEKLSNVSVNDLDGIDTNKYEIIYESYIIKDQVAILVKNKTDNTFGTYNIKTNKYTKLIDGEPSSLSKLLSTEKELYVGINARINDANKMVIYDLVNGKKVYELDSKEFGIQYYSNYGNYNVVKYTSESSDNYKNRYAVYDKNNKEIFRADDQIVIVDEDFVFGKEPSNNQLLLFSARKGKVLNNHDSLATKISLGESYFYKYNDTEKTYLYNSKVIN